MGKLTRLVFTILILAPVVGGAAADKEEVPPETRIPVLVDMVPEPVRGTWERLSPSRPKFPKLPFEITAEKYLDEQDLRDKKRGFFVTGLPRITSDPVEGVGFGLNAYFNFNGDDKDPFFPYTAYRTRVGAEISATTRGGKEALFDFDAPYIFDSKFRLRINAGYTDDPTPLYFGSTAATMADLSYAGQTYSRYDDYAAALNRTRDGNAGEAGIVNDTNYDGCHLQEASLGATLERSLFDGSVRVLGGFSLAAINVTNFNGVRDAGQAYPAGLSRLDADALTGTRGLGASLITTVRTGIVYDTRDLEPDPGRGLFAEITNELALKPLGASYNFDKLFLQVKYFWPLFPETFEDLVLAARAAMNFTVGDAPFFEYQDSWSSEGDIEGLGGLRTLRGFKQNRFLAPILGYANLELRLGIAKLNVAQQKFNVKVVPFFDFGRVWNSLSEIGFAGYRADGGLGVRVVWNQSTVVMVDYAASSEDQQLFLNFEHIF